MPTYRVYVLSSEDHTTGPPHVIECVDDHEAIAKAVQYVNLNAVELWEGPRFVMRFPSDE